MFKKKTSIKENIDEGRVTSSNEQS